MRSVETPLEQIAEHIGFEPHGWDDRKELASLFQDSCQLPEGGLTEEFYQAVIAVANAGYALAKEHTLAVPLQIPSTPGPLRLKFDRGRGAMLDQNDRIVGYWQPPSGGHDPNRCCECGDAGRPCVAETNPASGERKERHDGAILDS